MSDGRDVMALIEAHPLYSVVIDAIRQAALGKGERHGGSATPFLEQQWRLLAKHHGVGFLTGQAAKKLNEAALAFNAGGARDAFEREVLGAIVYSAMAVLYVDMTDDGA
jgi:hypothetical protein